MAGVFVRCGGGLGRRLRRPVEDGDLDRLWKEAIEWQNERIIAQISKKPQASGIVVDMRQAPGHNHLQFEQAMRRLRNEVSVNYDRVAVLLVSAAGVLQVNRLGRDDNAKTLVTMSEEAAVSFAMGLT